MGYGQSASGLQCSWGSDLDTRIPRAKLPPSALPPEVRAKLKLGGLKHTGGHADKDVAGLAYKPGGGCLEPRASDNGQYKAGCQKNFLRRGSGVPASERCSAAVRMARRPLPPLAPRPGHVGARGGARGPHRVQPGPAVCLIDEAARRSTARRRAAATKQHGLEADGARPRSAAGAPVCGEVRRRQPRHAKAAGGAPSPRSLEDPRPRYETRIDRARRGRARLCLPARAAAK